VAQDLEDVDLRFAEFKIRRLAQTPLQFHCFGGWGIVRSPTRARY